MRIEEIKGGALEIIFFMSRLKVQTLSQMAGVQTPNPPLTQHVTLSKLFKLFVPQFLRL